MAKTLVLAEKPSVGKDIARVLGCKSGGKGFLENDKYAVTWAMGHLVTLADPEIYDKRYEKWELNDLPIIPAKLKLVVIGKTSGQFNVVKSLLMRNDITRVVIATDAGREGELVARWILEKAHVNKPIDRLWISSVTDKAILTGFKQLKDGKLYESLYRCASARAEADWIVGINATRALTAKYNAQLSCGRVQTPTLAMVAKREDDIKSFKPRLYFGITMNAKNTVFTWDASNSPIIPNSAEKYGASVFDEQLRDKVLSVLQSGKKAAVVSEVSSVDKKTYPPLPYDLTRLQADANRIYGYSVKETLSLMQGLYETHKVLTYPRTDSQYLSSDLADTLPERIKACAIPAYRRICSKLSGNSFGKTAVYIDDSKVSDHHAIIPTDQAPDLSAMSDKERKIYELAVKRFLAALMPPYEYVESKVTLIAEKEIFHAKGRKVKSLGFRELYSDASDDDNTAEISNFSKAENINGLSFSKTSGKTKPPAYFTEATLLTAMENPSSFLDSDDKGLAKTLNITGGIGTVATRADIIDKLFNNFVIEKRGQEIYTTQKGRQLLRLVPKEMTSPALTAVWEQRLERIAKSSEAPEKFILEMKDYTQRIIREIKGSAMTYVHENITHERCPECGKYMLSVNGKKGRFLICQDRECGYRQNLAITTNARCPDCHKRMELSGSGDKKFFTCVCGHKESEEQFKKRVKENSNKMNKHEVEAYIKNQERDDTGNKAFAAAFARLKEGHNNG